MINPYETKKKTTFFSLNSLMCFEKKFLFLKSSHFLSSFFCPENLAQVMKYWWELLVRAYHTATFLFCQLSALLFLTLHLKEHQKQVWSLGKIEALKHWHVEHLSAHTSSSTLPS